MRWAAVGVVYAGILCAQNSPDELIAAGHWKRARAMVDERYRQNPSDALTCFHMSQIRNAFGDRQWPLPLAEKAVALDGRTARYHRQLAEVLGVTAQHANLMQQLLLARRFRKELDTALALDARDPQAGRDLLEFYLLAPGIAGGDVNKAQAEADRIAATDAAEGWLAHARVAEFQKRWTEQEGYLRRAVEASPASYRTRIALGRFYLDRVPARLEEASEQARQAIQLDRGRVDGYAILAAVYAERGEWKALDAVLTAGAAAVPDDMAPYFRAAERLHGRDAGRAERYLRVYLGQEPEGNEPPASEARARLARLGAD